MVSTDTIIQMDTTILLTDLPASKKKNEEKIKDTSANHNNEEFPTPPGVILSLMSLNTGLPPTYTATPPSSERGQIE